VQQGEKTIKRYLEENERVKHDYATYLRHAKGQDDTSIDKARAAIRRFEESTKFKPFKKFRNCPACLAALVAEFNIQPRRISAIN
jgi:hypothetical protein